MITRVAPVMRVAYPLREMPKDKRKQKEKESKTSQPFAEVMKQTKPK